MGLFSDIPARLSEELVEILHADTKVRIERIVSMGHISPPDFWYDQRTHEWVALLQGHARLRFEGDAAPIEMKAGDFLHIPAHRRHRVEWTDSKEACIWLAMHYG